jgi:hypothetical protein
MTNVEATLCGAAVLGSTPRAFGVGARALAITNFFCIGHSPLFASIFRVRRSMFGVGNWALNCPSAKAL